MWLPVLEPADYEGNGLILAEGSHRCVVQSYKDICISEVYREILEI